jgi:hypothetical protein
LLYVSGGLIVTWKRKSSGSRDPQDAFDLAGPERVEWRLAIQIGVGRKEKR